jgi:hypothetical protein
MEYQNKWTKWLYGIGSGISYIRPVKETLLQAGGYAKAKYLSENTLFLSGVDKENIFSEGSEGYKYGEEYADKENTSFPEDDN